MQVSQVAWIAAALLCLLSGSAAAVDGRIEINQASVTAAGGWPFVISNPGSYVLTSELRVDDGMDGIKIAADEVVIDLNGFAIRGSHVCEPGNCTAGSTIGIEAISAGTFLAMRSTILNGHVRGFGGDCVFLGTDALVDGVVVSSCGGDGVSTSIRGTVRESRVSRCGEFGLRLDVISVYADNMLVPNGLGGGSGGSVIGGADGCGNICTPGEPCVCAHERGRRYYLTTASYQGWIAANVGNCEDEFHFASYWEIYDTTSLVYDTNLGETRDDSGEGPPSGLKGWIRTGFVSTTGPAGQANCNNWSGLINSGSHVELNDVWTTTTEANERWSAGTTACTTSLPVWCVEDF